MFVVAALLNIPGIKIVIFSTGKRASNSLMETALKFMISIPGASRRICKRTAEECYVAERELPQGCGLNSQDAKDAVASRTTSSLKSLPASKTGTCVYYPLSPTQRNNHSIR
jgi:hypothetical protein